MPRRIPIKVTTRVRTGSVPVRCVCGRVIQRNTTHTCSKTR